MATIKKKSQFDIEGRMTPGGEQGYKTAARRYVLKGLPELMRAQGIPVNPINKQKFINKMVPIISTQVKAESERAYNRSKKKK